MTVSHEDARRAAECFERAMKLDPSLRGAVYAYTNNSYVREHRAATQTSSHSASDRPSKESA